MRVEIEETVCFLASFLYGIIPRRHVDEFAEILANRLLDVVMEKSRSPNVFHLVVNAAGKSDPIVQSAAEEAYVDLTEVLSLLPNSLIVEIRPGCVNALNADTGQMKPIYPQTNSPVRSQDYGRRFRTCNGGSLNSPNGCARHSEKLKRRPQLKVEHHYSCSETDGQLCVRPYFELERGNGVYTAKAFAATRFGSTKPKNHQRVDAGSGYHPYTTPSLYAYLQLLIFLNALACITVWSEKLEKEAENEEVNSTQQQENDFSSNTDDVLQNSFRARFEFIGFVDGLRGVERDIDEAITSVDQGVMNLMYFERKRGVPDDYRSPIIVPTGHYSGVLFAGEVLINDPREANDLNDMGYFGCFIERREPIVTPECFRIERNTFISPDKVNKLETRKRALRLATIEKAMDITSKETNKIASNETPSVCGAESGHSKDLDALKDCSSEAITRSSDPTDRGRNEEKSVSGASVENMDTRSETNENEEINENTKQMELWANMISKDRRLRLGMEEAMYLMYDLSVLEVSVADKQLSADDLWRRFYSYAGISFVKRYACYRRLRQLGWVVRPGLPYGVDFMLYCDGPDYHHSSAAVRILDEHIDASLFSTLNRTLNNMKKTLVEIRVDIPVGLPLEQGVKCVGRINVEYVTVATCRLQDLGIG